MSQKSGNVLVLFTNLSIFLLISGYLESENLKLLSDLRSRLLDIPLYSASLLWMCINFFFQRSAIIKLDSSSLSQSISASSHFSISFAQALKAFSNLSICFSLTVFEVPGVLSSVEHKLLLKTWMLFLSCVGGFEMLQGDFFSRDKDIRSFSSRLFFPGNSPCGLFNSSLSSPPLPREFHLLLFRGLEDNGVREALFFSGIRVLNISDSEGSLVFPPLLVVEKVLPLY